MPTLHLLIKGKVQGVFFRATAQRIAKELNISGVIKNTEKGDVEATVSGDDHQLKSFLEWCKKGPKKAKVEEIIVTEKQETSFSDFTVIRE